MVDASSVQKLNSAIEKINVQRTKAETRIDLLKKQLSTNLEKYKSQYGVDLTGRNFTETKKKINAEVALVSGKVQEEYDLKLQVVKAINEGDYEWAYQLLGIKNPNTVEKEEPASDALSGTALDDIKGLDDESVDMSEEEYSLEEEDSSMEYEESMASEDKEDIVPSMEMEEEEDDALFGENLQGASPGASAFLQAVAANKNVGSSGSSGSGKGIKGSSVAEAVEDVGFGDFSGFEMEPEDDEEDSFLPDSDAMGFGAMLQGSKFSV